MFVSDLRHFLDIPFDAPGPARKMAKHLGFVVRVAASTSTSATPPVFGPSDIDHVGRRCFGGLALPSKRRYPGEVRSESGQLIRRGMKGRRAIA
jgi:hypothetical protein